MSEVGTCGATISLAIAPQLFLNGCVDPCAASVLAVLSASQIRLWMIVFQSNVIKVNKKILIKYRGVARILNGMGGQIANHT